MDHINLTVNKIPRVVGNEVTSNTTLLEYIRKHLQLRGTKSMCKGGRCGACLMAVSKSPGEPFQAVNSCLVSVTSCHNWNIMTIENLGNSYDGYHDIQKAIAKKYGTQCGYCTPGWVIALYCLLNGNSNMTMHEIEQSLGSNVCRCTGYRAILEALKMFGKDAPKQSIMEIQNLEICNNSRNICASEKCGSEKCCSGGSDDPDWCVVTNKEVTQNPVLNIILKDGKAWYRVEELSEIFEILELKGYDSYMLVNGNTARGLVAREENPNTMIDISNVSALKGCVIDQNLDVGGGVTITELIKCFDYASNKESFKYLNDFNVVLKRFANIPVKNIGTVAGNLMLTHEHPGVVSDLCIMCEAVGVQVTILNAAGVLTTLTMSNFLQTNMRGQVLVKLLFPPLSNEYKFVAYKIAGKTENAGSILCAAFLYKLDLNNKVLECRIALGLTQLLRATNTERYLLNKILCNNETLQGAVTILNNELILTDKPPATSAKYRKNLAIGLFYKSLLSICPPNVLSSSYRSGAIDLGATRPLSKSYQSFDTDSSLYPLNESIPKVESMIQCSGEAPYTDDVPTLPNEVFAAFVLSNVAVGKIENIDASAALEISGVIAFYSAEDIPGTNTFTTGIAPVSTTNEVVFCDGNVMYFNQPIGVIVAESQYLAEKAAKLVTVKYSNVRTPVIDILEAKDDPKRTIIYNEIPAKETGKNVSKIIKGSVTVRGQFHTCMETLSCVTHPIEEGLKIYTGTQNIDAVHVAASRALNLPQNKIDIYVRRVGGSYGSKISRNTQVVIACSLVVQKLHRPCRLILNLKTNIRAMGKRLPCHGSFDMGVDEDGIIQYNNYDLFEDNGYIVNEPLAAFTLDCYNNCYKSKMWNFKVYNTVTDTASNTWCRSPGTLESIAMAEFMMERISYDMNLDPIKVRLANLDTDEYDAVREMYETLKIDCKYAERRVAVDKFNKENRWKKRGLRFAFMIWNPIKLPIYYDTNITVYYGDGSVVITHSGIEMGQGINTKAIQICAHALGISVDRIQVKAVDTCNAGNSFVSGASVTSGFVGYGVLKCAKELQTKLESIRAQLDNPTWLEVVRKAFDSGIDLQTHAFVNINDNVAYHVHGVACAEVEIDVLTGEHQTIQVDLAADAGQTINPGIDIGQTEGGFMMAVGYWTSERLVYDKSTGELLTDSLNQYWVPQVQDVPQTFNTYLRKKSYSADSILGTKATGEPATCLGVVIPIAIREAIVAARAESGISSTDWFNIDGPYTIEQINLACSTRMEDFKFY